MAFSAFDHGVYKSVVVPRGRGVAPRVGGGGGGRRRGRRRRREKDDDDDTILLAFGERTASSNAHREHHVMSSSSKETETHPFGRDEEEEEEEDKEEEEEERRRRLLKAKRKLIESCRGTYRGALFQSSPRETKRVFDAKRELEKLYHHHHHRENVGGGGGVSERDPVEERLRGRWKLIYTTAVDVTGLLVFSIPPPPLPFLPPPPIVVGDIYQEFKTDTKEIVNEIRVSVPVLLEEKDGVVLRVNAKYKDRSSTNKTALELVFQEAVVSDVRISEFTEMLLAPAVLPRGELNQRVLLFLRDFEVRFPLFGRAATAMGGASNENERNEEGKRTPGASVGKYEFSYCDEDVLIGKATGSQGIFIFTKEGDQSEQ
jgi:hypothetical protein